MRVMNARGTTSPKDGKTETKSLSLGVQPAAPVQCGKRLRAKATKFNMHAQQSGTFFQSEHNSSESDLMRETEKCKSAKIIHESVYTNYVR